MAPDETERVRIILTTAGREEGPMIARHLVEKRLAACVNMTEVRSCYRWEGKICDDPEVLLIIKTAAERVHDAMAAIRESHSYDLPEIIVLPVMGGYTPYISWIEEETRR